MTARADIVEGVTPVALAARARALAEGQRTVRRAPKRGGSGGSMAHFGPALDRVHRQLAVARVEDAGAQRAVEWFLDNYYLIRRCARQVAQDLPQGFAQRLPLLAEGADAGQPRIEAVAYKLVDGEGVELDRPTLAAFLAVYQQVAPLSIAELWALPTMLRAALLGRLLACLGELEVSGGVPADPPGRPAASREGRSGLSTPLAVERSIRGLRLLAELDWKVFFEENSCVEAILLDDPAKAYARMDFNTCDDYRKAVEDLAWATEQAEAEVAGQAILLAREGGSDPRRGHVGFYLVGAGRGELEASINFHPRGVDRLRRLATRFPMAAFFLPVTILTAATLLLLWWSGTRAAPWVWDPLTATMLLATCMLAAPPIWSVAAMIMQWLFAKLLPPRRLPKLDFSEGVPEDARALVVIPTMLTHPEGVAEMLQQIEQHFLSNPDPRLGFALLTDYADASEQHEEPALFDSAAEGIALLNERHRGEHGEPFLLLHREPLWNPAEGRFMGWERKRGKLEELNRLLRGHEDTSYVHRVGDPARLEGIRFVITLDSDTELPLGAARRLIGLLAHPLNQAVFDPRTGRVVDGYTVVQPRLETSPSSFLSTPFARIFAGRTGLDIYTHASSELYQDLFGSGIYCGKGIYDVDAFTRSLTGRIPENALLSHDLLEGVHGRTALASDIVVYEQYPESYGTYSRRLHRWVRGDWQLVPWLLLRVPSLSGGSLRNRLSSIDRWKILDNLRRSVVGPCLCLLLLAGWTVLPFSPLLTTLVVLLVLQLPLLPGLTEPGRWREALARCLLAVVFILHEASVVVDAVVRVFYRSTISHQHLLEWTSSADTSRKLANRSLRGALWLEMRWSPLLAAAIAVLLQMLRPAALPIAAPLLLAWFFAPELARWLSLPGRASTVTLDARDERALRLLARRTWLFFETFVGPSDQWLPIDNYQEAPFEQTAHRTSPTNIGLMLLSTLAAYDFAYLGPNQLALRLRGAFDSLGRLVRYRGHLLNWYETGNLEPLLPQYVSTVDSGNYAGCLLALKAGCREAARGAVMAPEIWRGLGDSLALVEDSLKTIEARAGPSTVEGKSAAVELRGVLTRMHEQLPGRRDAGMVQAYARLVAFCDEGAASLRSALLALLQTGIYRHEPELLHSLRTAMQSFEQHCRGMRQEIDSLLPWLSLAGEFPGFALDLPSDLRLDEVPGAAHRLQEELTAWETAQRRRSEPDQRTTDSLRDLRAALARGSAKATALRNELMDLAECAEREAYAMDFRLLYDARRKLFHIGYNVTADQADANYYDLLASEARLASYFAIIKGDVPHAHWYTLGRPMTRLGRGQALLSWGGTMFEYLMPSLLMRSRQGTLLQQSIEAAVDAQRAYGSQKQVPWGISESSYARRDAEGTYQYRSFGVPGLGFKRDLEDDLVIAPYASLLALSVRPEAVAENLSKFQGLGLGGTYGLFEAIDFHPEPILSENRKPHAVVHSYMAHHQGMALLALDNFFHSQVMVERFHAEPSVSAGELLLNEREPGRAPAEWPLVAVADRASGGEQLKVPRAPDPWSPGRTECPQAWILGNDRLTSIVTYRGGGGLRWRGLAITRFQPDSTCDGDGIWFYLRDRDRHLTWRATSRQASVTFSAHQAELHQRDNGISVHLSIAVAPDHDAELRRITLHNESDTPRRLSLTSAGEPLLLHAVDAAKHPAFARLFLESEFLAGMEALVFTRRPRLEGEGRAVLVHRLVREGDGVSFGACQTDRSVFFGRCGDAESPGWLEDPAGDGESCAGMMIDPVMALSAELSLAPRQTVTLAFVTSVASSRGAAIAIAARYGSMHAVRWAFRDAERGSAGRLSRVGMDPGLLPSIQRFTSALLFSDPAFRAHPEAGEEAEKARPCKSAFWGQGISGDLPVVLLRVHDASATILSQLVLAQRFLRSHSVNLDLVALATEPSSYGEGGVDGLRDRVVVSATPDWLQKPGGVYLLALDQLADEEVRRLARTARVILDSRDGSLAEQMSRHAYLPPAMPRFEPGLVREPLVPPTPVHRERLFDNGLGGFSEDGREYVISVRPGQPTPAPWCNVLCNPDFGCLVSEAALGSTWSGNAGENRLTPWRNDPVFDTPSEVLYLRDEETGEVWSSTPLPAGAAVETTVRHGAGYTTYERESHGLVQLLTVFVPPDSPLKIARLALRNTLPRHRRVTLTYYAEWVLGSLREEQSAYIDSEIDRANACLMAACAWNPEFAGRVAFLACDGELHGFTTDRAEFLGPAGSYARPDALTRWGLSDRVSGAGDPCGALQMHAELAPAGTAGGEVVSHFLLGQAEDRDAAVALVGHFRQREAVDSAWQSLGDFWDGLLRGVQVKTPDPAMDVMLNQWLLYQTLSSRVFGRTGFYQSSGAFGFRDQLQDVLSLFNVAPDRARAHILEAAAHQFEEGDVLHWWHPPSGRGVRTRCSDDMAWLPYVAACYVSATGDAAIMSERIPFLVAEPLAENEPDRYAEFPRGQQVEPLLEHCRRALERAMTAGRHGLPLMAGGDWNDGMNLVGARGLGESVWLGWFLCDTLNRFAGLCESLGEAAEDVADWRSRAASLRAAIEDCAWDGGWYLRAFHDDGSLVGSASAEECRIDSIAQSWAVLSSGADPKRAALAMGAVEEQLVNEEARLVLLLRPPFDHTLHDPGYIRSYPPGVRENGGQYTHAATWVGWAFATLGDGDRAAKVFRLINPVLRTLDESAVRRYRAEPYVLAGDVYGIAPWVGRGGWSWYTGSAAWTYRLGVEAILGLRRDAGQLCIDPCIPRGWPRFEAWLRLDGRDVHVIVENPDAVSGGVASVTLDGVPLPSNRVALDPSSAACRHEVRVMLGERTG